MGVGLDRRRVLRRRRAEYIEGELRRQEGPLWPAARVAEPPYPRWFPDQRDPMPRKKPHESTKRADNALAKTPRTDAASPISSPPRAGPGGSTVTRSPLHDPATGGDSRAVLSGVLDDRLLQDARGLISDARVRVSRSVNTGLVGLYWNLGRRIQDEVLENMRGEYGQAVVASLAERLSREFGSGFTRPNLFHMVRFAEAFPDQEIVYTLCRQLTWSHFRTLFYLEDPLQRAFYAEMVSAERWSVRELRRQIEGMLFERVALSKRPTAVATRQLTDLREGGTMTPDMVFTDPMNLSALGLREVVAERDLEAAMLAEIEVVLRELGIGFAFVARQYRFTLDSDSFAIDLLFFNRRLRCLVAVDLKLGKFDPRDFGQMELYLRWLARHERYDGEGVPLGLILCAGKSTERVELLQLEERGIRVAEYLLDLPPREVLTRRLHEAIERARDRVDHRADLV